MEGRQFKTMESLDILRLHHQNKNSHQNSVWRVGDDEQAPHEQEFIVKVNKHQSGVNTESNHQRRRRQLSNALLGDKSKIHTSLKRVNDEAHQIIR